MLNSILDDYYDYACKYIDGFKDLKYEEISVTKLANGYCDADEKSDEFQRDVYMYALIYRYQHLISYLHQKYPSLKMDFEDWHDFMYDCIMKAMKYRSWRVEGNKLYNNPRGADICINGCVKSEVANLFKHSNTMSACANYDTFSLNTPLTSDLDDTDYMDTIEGKEDVGYTPIELIINDLVKEDRVIEGMIVDSICYQDTFRKKELSPRLVVSFLNHIDEKEYKSYFMSTYKIKEVDMNKALKKWLKLNSSVKANYIKETIYSLQNQEGIKDLLCC